MMAVEGASLADLFVVKEKADINGEANAKIFMTEGLNDLVKEI